jgi:hypothetical protein
MRFQLFKMFESRTSELSEDEFRKILHTKCKDFVKSPKLLQRSKTSESSEFSYINPKSFDRSPLKKSDKFTDGVESRHHTLLMDNLPSWKDFPKRSQSVIGLTSEDPRVIFGFHRYLIIPFDGARFGVAPSSDLWGCKVNITDYRPLTTDPTFSFNDFFSEMMVMNKVSDNSYSEMMSDLQELYKEFKSLLVYPRPDSSGIHIADTKSTDWIIHLIPLFKKFHHSKFESVEEGFNHFFDPNRFKGTDLDEQEGFQVMDWKYLSSLGNYETYEFWTDSECLLWYIGKTEKGSDIEEAYQSFISDFIINK